MVDDLEGWKPEKPWFSGEHNPRLCTGKTCFQPCPND